MDNTKTSHKPRVAIASGTTREDAVRNAIELVREDILAKVRGNILIKPNFLSSTKTLASTQVEAVRPVLELLKDASLIEPSRFDSVIIGEGATRSTLTAFTNFGYENLASEFNVKLVDLNSDTYSHKFEILTQTRGIHTIDYSDISAGSDTIISVAVAKTHDFATVTLSSKNLMGCLRRIHRPRMHGVELGKTIESTGEVLWNKLDRYPLGMNFVMGLIFGSVQLSRYIQKKRHHGPMPGLLSQIRALSENLVRLGKVLLPDIAVIDAFEAMEGEGPGSGTSVKMGIAVAGTDSIACDAVMAYMMGFDPLSIGHFYLANDCGLGTADLENIETIGEEPSQHVRNLKPHSNYPVQIRWHEAWKD
ncbi:MAG TPA: DUF362 domain-containing protein [bacterium]|nr:DUF362 domain-containing protein [bacterium]